jgi:ubiquinone/menaquinone biosynthesis C-methylase UbiE
MKVALLGRQFNVSLNRLSVSRRIEFRILSRYLRLSASDTLCDIGCGDGFWTTRFVKMKNCRAFGIDLNFSRVSDAHQNGTKRASFVKGDVQVLPYRSGRFDKVVSVCVLEHVENDLAALKEMRRVLKKDGMLAITVDSFSFPGISAALKEFHRTNYHVVNYYTYDSLKEKLLSSGFEPCEYKFITSSGVSRYFYELYISHRKPSYFLFPLAYPLSLVADWMWGSGEYGFKLAVKARAV